MRLALVLLVLVALVAGCTATGQDDPFAYTKKPLYAGGFNLAKLGSATDTQEFRVQDGSIASLRILVWVNATSGGATVTITDPSGRTILNTTDSTERASPLNLGAWKVQVTGREGSAGTVHILVVRG